MAEANYFAMEQSGAVSSGKIGPKCSAREEQSENRIPFILPTRTPFWQPTYS